MPEGPQGQKRPADAVANAVVVARIATGEIDDEIEISGRAPGKTAGGDARAAKLAPYVRAEIASRAAKARWSKRETEIMIMQTQGAAADRREAVRMYPNNSLKEAKGNVRNLAFEMIRETFKK